MYFKHARFPITTLDPEFRIGYDNFLLCIIAHLHQFQRFREMDRESWNDVCIYKKEISKIH